MLKIKLTLAALFLLAALSSQAMAGESVGFININRLLYESEVGRQAIGEYQEFLMKKQKAVAAKQREWALLQQRLKTEGSTMAPQELEKQLTRLRILAKEGERMAEDAREDANDEERALRRRIFKRANTVLQKVARKQGYKIILQDQSALGYLDPEVDITNAVIKELNKKK